MERWKLLRSDKLSMSIEPSLYEAIQMELKPGDRTLEFGSGLSTFAFVRPDSTHLAIENDARQASLINITLGCCQYFPVDPSTGWYKVPDFDADFRIILVDGPSLAASGDRLAGFSWLARNSTPDTVYFIDDVHRNDEMSLASRLANRCGRLMVFKDRWVRI
jgi:hypothetical protein